MSPTKVHHIVFGLFIFIYSCQNPSVPDSKLNSPAPFGPIPTERQLKWHKMEMNAFIHFTTNTFTDKEWGYGDESPDVFNPSDFNPDQWMSTLKAAGFRGVILTCKHHDGFCLWPSEYTEHSVKNSSWRNGEGNVVEEVFNSCKKYGLKFGIYLSPWDRNRADYGEPSYVDYYRSQLKELFTKYNPVFEMWFDGANGGDGYYGGANETRKIDGENFYDWPNTIEMVRKMEPEVIFFSDAGPDIRWIGNEKGHAGETNWNTLSIDTLFAGKPGLNSLLNSGSEDGTSWVPGEVDVSIRPGWFYHESEDSLVKTPRELFDIYLSSVGRGSNLLLNIPPDRSGQLHEKDVENLLKWRELIDQTFKENFALKAVTEASSQRGKRNSKLYSSSNLTDNNTETFWAAKDDDVSARFDILLKESKEIKYILIQEYISLGQRVKSFKVEAFANDNWIEVAKGSTIGYKRIIKINPVETSQIRVRILDSKASPLISNFELY